MGGAVTVLAPRRRILDSALSERLDARLGIGAPEPVLPCVSVDVAESVCSRSAEGRRFPTLRSNDAALARMTTSENPTESDAGRPRALRSTSASSPSCSATSTSAIERLDDWATTVAGCRAGGREDGVGTVVTRAARAAEPCAATHGVEVCGAAAACAAASDATVLAFAAPSLLLDATATTATATPGEVFCEARGRATAGAHAGNESAEPTAIGAPSVGGADIVTLKVLHVRAPASQQPTLRLLV
jgi:hypothetical protein